MHPHVHYWTFLEWHKLFYWTSILSRICLATHYWHGLYACATVSVLLYSICWITFATRCITAQRNEVQLLVPWQYFLFTKFSARKCLKMSWRMVQYVLVSTWIPFISRYINSALFLCWPSLYLSMFTADVGEHWAGDVGARPTTAADTGEDEHSRGWGVWRVLSGDRCRQHQVQSANCQVFIFFLLFQLFLGKFLYFFPIFPHFLLVFRCALCLFSANLQCAV